MNNQLTINELRAYQAGRLDGPARHRVERLLLEDPFYADALEGLEALQRAGASLPKQTAQLRRALHERINESATERRLFPLWVTSMVASIVLMMGVALYFIYTTDPAKTSVTKRIEPTHAEPIVVDIGPNDSAIAKTVATVPLIEDHAARLRSFSRPLPTERKSVSSDVVAVVELAPATTGVEKITSPEFAVQSEESQTTSRRITNPERAFGPDAPEVTFWSDASPRLTLARSFVTAPRLAERGPTERGPTSASAQEAMEMNKRSATQLVSFDTPKDSTTDGIPLAPLHKSVHQLSEVEDQVFQKYLKKEATPLFHGPLSVSIRTKADGSIKRVSVDDGIRIEDPDGKRHRDYKPTPEVVAEAERLVRQYPNWPKKRQSLLWILGRTKD